MGRFESKYRFEQFDQNKKLKNYIFQFNEIFKGEMDRSRLDRRALCPKRRNDGKTGAIRKNSRLEANSARNRRQNDFKMARRGITESDLADLTEDHEEMAETGLASTSNQPIEAIVSRA